MNHKNIYTVALTLTDPTLTAAPDYPANENKDSEWEVWRKACKAFLGTGIINIKKTDDGNTITPDFVINDYACMNNELLKAQIENISPDIVACGGTFDCLRRIYSEDEMTTIVPGNIAKVGSTIFIALAAHPSYWGKDQYDHHGFLTNDIMPKLPI